jgi:formylmethanofuran dehydrogenase subunit E
MNKNIRYRIVCPLCNKGFDGRKGLKLSERVVCPNCYKNNIRFLMLNNY